MSKFVNNHRTRQLMLRACPEHVNSDVVILQRVPLPDTTRPRSFLQTLLRKIPLSAVTGVDVV